MKKLFLLSFLFPLLLFSQQKSDQFCGTRGFAPHLLPHHHLQQHGPEAQTGDKIFLIKYYVVRDDQGNGGAQSDARVRRAIEETNTYFAGHGIQFALCGSVIYKDSSRIRYGFNDFSDWANQISDPRYFNVFENLANPGFPIPVSAYGSFPGSPNRIVTFGSISGRVLAHELAHNLGLYHTFGNGVGFSITDEWVNGGNCTTTGDEVCDTPADPYQYGINTTCSYEDTVLRDINGDLYSPDITNIMSYFPCQTDHFSPGQHARMNDTYEQERFYVTSLDSSQFTRMDGVPHVLCEGANVKTKLSGYPAGGTFSGPGVVGDSLVMTNLPAGQYNITYHLPPAAQVAPYSKTGAVQPVFYGWPYTSDSLWLAFRAKETAPLDAIRIRARADSQQIIQWRLLSGQGLGGTVLVSQTDTLPADSNMHWYRFQLRNTFTQQAGQFYTLAFATADTFTWETADTGSSHPQEQSSLTNLLINNVVTSRNPCFATEITSTQMACHGDSISYRFTVVAPAVSYWEPEDRFCVTENAVSMESFFSFNTDFYFREKEFEVNGQLDSLVRPNQLGAGTHNISLNYKDYNGCYETHAQVITVYDTPHVSIQQIFCESDPTYGLQSFWPNGTFRINGSAVDSIVPPLLGVGQHLLEMELPNVYDTLRLLNQEVPLPSGLVYSYRAIKDSSFWQSFRPDTSGYLGQVKFNMIIHDSAHFVRSVYRGLPSTGQLLRKDSTWLYPGNWDKVVAEPPLFSIPVEKDSLYSVEIIRLDSVVPFSNRYASVLYDSTVVYTRGTSHFTDKWGKETHLYFSVDLDFQLSCGDEQTRMIEIIATPLPPTHFLPTPDTVFQNSMSSLLWDDSWADSLDIHISGGSCLNCTHINDSLRVSWDSLGWAKIVIHAFNETSCEGDSVIRWVWVKAQNTTSIYESQDIHLEVYPNPFTENIRAELHIPSTESVHFSLWDMYGRKVWERKNMLLNGGDHSFSFNIPELSSAMYVLEVRIGKSKKAIMMHRQ